MICFGAAPNKTAKTCFGSFSYKALIVPILEKKTIRSTFRPTGGLYGESETDLSASARHMGE
jgi:hypothetical protein